MLTPDERREMDERMQRTRALIAKANDAIQASNGAIARPRSTTEEREELVRALQVAGVTENQARQQAAVLLTTYRMELR